MRPLISLRFPNEQAMDDLITFFRQVDYCQLNHDLTASIVDLSAIVIY